MTKEDLTNDPALELIERILKIEGGYVNDPDDSGGETKYGITEEVAREDGYKGYMKNLTKKRAIKIYKTKYWDKFKGSEIYKIDPNLAYKLLDISVNMGVSVAIRFLQRGLNGLNYNLNYSLKMDSVMGSQTFSALLEYYKTKDGSVLVKIINCMQGIRYLSIAEASGEAKKYLTGWVSKRIN